MDFFKSVFSDDPPNPENTHASSPNSQPLNPNPNIPTITTAFAFGSSLFKTLATKSGSVIHTYRQDLHEFSSGIQKEAAVIRRVVTDLPASFEAGAAAAQESLESVGQVIDNITDIISQGKDSIFISNDFDNDSGSESFDDKLVHLNNKPYSRLDAQIRGLQCDLNTYCREVDEVEEFNEWNIGFVLGDMEEEIEDLVEENRVIREIYEEVVPSKVDRETFWGRYFFRVFKVRRAEEARAKMVKRAIEGEGEEELSWDDDEYEYEDRCLRQGEGSEVCASLEMGSVGVSGAKCDDRVGRVASFDEVGTSGGKLAKLDEKIVGSEVKTDSDISVISSQVSHEEEDIGWDAIEDTGSSDEHKVVADGGSPNRADLCKRRNAGDEEEDLTWDIEDADDEPVKS